MSPDGKMQSSPPPVVAGRRPDSQVAASDSKGKAAIEIGGIAFSPLSDLSASLSPELAAAALDDLPRRQASAAIAERLESTAAVGGERSDADGCSEGDSPRMTSAPGAEGALPPEPHTDPAEEPPTDGEESPVMDTKASPSKRLSARGSPALASPPASATSATASLLLSGAKSKRPSPKGPPLRVGRASPRPAVPPAAPQVSWRDPSRCARAGASPQNRPAEATSADRDDGEVAAILEHALPRSVDGEREALLVNPVAKRMLQASDKSALEREVPAAAPVAVVKKPAPWQAGGAMTPRRSRRLARRRAAEGAARAEPNGAAEGTAAAATVDHALPRARVRVISSEEAAKLADFEPIAEGAP